MPIIIIETVDNSKTAIPAATFGAGAIMRPRNVVVKPLALYLHIPFCQARCHYCAFNTYAGLKPLQAPYVTALARALAVWGEALGPAWEIRTIFFGGGTPSLLPERDVARLLEVVHKAFAVAGDPEISLEANPGTVEHGSFRELQAAGVNRLSIGVQSFQRRWQRFLGRIHSTEEAVGAYNEARAAGFENINLDLIYGMPGQTAAEWEDDLRQAIALGPEHLSCYSLIVEEGTILARGVVSGRIPPPDHDEAADRHEEAERLLASAGYEQYEICNWSRPDRRSRHNLVYWHNEPWLGLGPGARSYLSPYRFADIEAPDQYILRLTGAAYDDLAGSLDSGRSVPDEAALRAMPVVGFMERLSPELERAETAILGLRLNDGLSRPRFGERFGEDPVELYAEALAEMIAWGLVEATPSALRLTANGRLLGNEVFARLLPPPPASGLS